MGRILVWRADLAVLKGSLPGEPVWQVWTGLDRSGQGLDRSGQVWTGLDRIWTGLDRFGQVCRDLVWTAGLAGYE